MSWFSDDPWTVPAIMSHAMALSDSELVELFTRLRGHISARSSIREDELRALHEAIGFVPKETK